MNGIVNWFVHNPIAANLLMLAMLIGGYIGYQDVKKEMFPTYMGNRIDVAMEYPGASASEVEQQIVVRIEEAIADLPGIFQISSESRQGFALVGIDVIEGFDVRDLLSDIKSRVDAINTFPASAERAIIKQQVQRQFLMWIALFGDADHRTLKDLAYRIRDEMSVLQGVSDVVITGLKHDELSIEISEANLQRYNLSFNEVATAIRHSSLNVPAGTLRSKNGDIHIQTRAQAYDHSDFSKIVVRSQKNGAQLLLGDIASIKDGFSEDNIDFSMNGKPGLNMRVNISDDPLLFEGTKNARKYIKEIQKHLPPGVKLKINLESKNIFDSRFNLLKNNAIGGLILVYIILMLFLRPMLAFWVVSGIATTFAGAIWLLPYLDVSINMLSMFAFIMVLGIIVDDAIIVGESVYRQQKSGNPENSRENGQHGKTGELGKTGKYGKHAASAGTQTVVRPISLAVISTIVFFLPMILVPSTVLLYTSSIFYVVMLCLIFSLTESLFILPSHLSHMKAEQPSKHALLKTLGKSRRFFAQKMEDFSNNTYRAVLERVLQHKTSIFLAFFVIFTTLLTLVAAGWISFSMFPSVPMPQVVVQVSYAEGTSFASTHKTAQHILDQVNATSINTQLLRKNDNKPFIREINRELNGTSISVFVGLTADEQRKVSADEVAEVLRHGIGALPEAQSYSLNSSQIAGGPEITLNLNMHDNSRDIQKVAVKDVVNTLASYPGVRNVRSNLDSERNEIEIELKPFAETLGVSISEIAQQIRYGFYGVEVQRIPRAKEDVKVMLRYTAQERASLNTLETLRVRTSDGREIPISELANIKRVPGPSVIRRVDRKRNIQITAEVSDSHDANKIVSTMLDENLAQWQRTYAGFNLSTDDTLRTQADFLPTMMWNFVKMALLVWALFAISFRSLFQPCLVLLALPFGFVGAVLGHMLWGMNFSMFSIFGLLACCGVVVNDNLVLITRINQLRKQGLQSLDAVLQAGVDRFRPIVLTSATTFVGLMPIMFERSLQAKFLKPMVVSLSCGVSFATLAALFLVPCCYYGGYRFKSRFTEYFISLKRKRKSVSESLSP
ncbi:multidrug efflux pump subunit AcrB [Alteromonadaceae bacterium 2753L.S.0a.02]|nr:multidrug efflux pump subunit AcrB [Alteromonadaceae bacterium 2753L.S.0a.02]